MLSSEILLRYLYIYFLLYTDLNATCENNISLPVTLSIKYKSALIKNIRQTKYSKSNASTHAHTYIFVRASVCAPEERIHTLYFHSNMFY